MTLYRLMSQALTVQTVGPATQDAYGDWVPGALGAPFAVSGYLAQETTSEFLVNRDTTVTTWKCFLPATTVIGHQDYINFGSQRFQVDGEPHYVYNPRTSAISHVECKLVVING